MLPHYLIEDFLATLRERAEALFLPPGAQLDDEDFVEWMMNVCGWGLAQAKDIVAGVPEAFDWEEEDIYLTCHELHLDPDLMEILFQPTSKEGLVYTLDEHLAERESHCEICHELVQATRDAEDIEGAYTAALAYMDHVFVDDEDEDEDEQILMAKQVLPAFFALPRSSQYRILSLIHEELESQDGPNAAKPTEISPMAILVGLRESMPATLIQLLDHAWDDDCAVKLEKRDVQRVEKFMESLHDQGVEALPIHLDDDTLTLDHDQQMAWKSLKKRDQG